MNNNLKFMVDNNGNKQSVVIPIKMWNELNANYKKLEKKIEILAGIKDGLREVKNAEKSGKKLQTLKDFLSESDS